MYKFTDIALVLAACIGCGLAISCYECNSWFDQHCDDPFKSFQIGKVDCEDKYRGSHLPDLNSTVCRKLVHRVGNMHRVVRSCGWIDDRKKLNGRDCVRKSGTYEVSVKYCSCYEDNCNSAGTQQMSLLVLGAGAATWILYLRT